MARATRGKARAQQQLRALPFKLMLAGSAMLVIPAITRGGGLPVPWKPLAPFGLALLGIGLCGMVLQHYVTRRMNKSSRVTDTTDESITPSTYPGHSQHAKPDRVAHAFESAYRHERSAAAKRTKPTIWSVDVLHDIEWRRFEALVESYFAQIGFATRSQSHGPDDGIDIWLYAPSNNEQAIGIVQCKHWNAKTVGVAHVRELLGVMTAQRISRGQFVSSSGFSEDALAFAQANRIHTIDGARLLELIRQRGEAQQQALLEVALDGEYWKPTCATCGVKMVERTPSKGGRKFWGCAKYPKCRNRLGMRGG